MQSAIAISFSCLLFKLEEEYFLIKGNCCITQPRNENMVVIATWYDTIFFFGLLSYFSCVSPNSVSFLGREKGKKLKLCACMIYSRGFIHKYLKYTCSVCVQESGHVRHYNETLLKRNKSKPK